MHQVNLEELISTINIASCKMILVAHKLFGCGSFWGIANLINSSAPSFLRGGRNTHFGAAGDHGCPKSKNVSPQEGMMKFPHDLDFELLLDSPTGKSIDQLMSSTANVAAGSRNSSNQHIPNSCNRGHGSHCRPMEIRN